MSDLTEVEIFDCLRDNFRKAAEHCFDLARLPLRGPTYQAFRHELKLIEGACRQAAVWRSDSRWYQIGMQVAKAHALAGEWLRGVKGADGIRKKVAPGHMHPLFVKLAENLRAGEKLAEQYRTQRTGRIGAILPKPLEAPHRDTRPAHILLPPGMTMSKGGVILPAHPSVQ